MSSLIEARTMHRMLKRQYTLNIHKDISAHATSHFQNSLINAPFLYRICDPRVETRG